MLLQYKISLTVSAKAIITPVYPDNYWFVTTYIVFCFCIPIINRLLTCLNKKQHYYVVAIGMLLIPCYNLLFENVGGNLGYFIYIYFFVAYIKKYEPEITVYKRPGLSFVLITIVVMVLTESIVFVGDFYNNQTIINQAVRFHDSRNVITLLQAFCLFCFFRKIKPFSSKIVNLIAASSLGVYLLSENIVARGEDGCVSILWNEIFSMAKYYNNGNFVLYSFSVIIALFICSSVVDFLFRKIIKKIMNNEIFDKMSNRVNRLLE